MSNPSLTADAPAIDSPATSDLRAIAATIESVLGEPQHAALWDQPVDVRIEAARVRVLDAMRRHPTPALRERPVSLG